VLEYLTPEQRENLERMSFNLARAAMTAQGAIAEAALRQADRPAALSADPFHVSSSIGEVMSRLGAQPERLMRAQADLFNRYMDLWKSAASARLARRPSHRRPGQGRQALSDPDWSSNRCSM